MVDVVKNMSDYPVCQSGCYSEYHNGVARHWPVWFSQTDAGRSTSKRPKSKNDCAVRAVALAFGILYDDAYDRMALCGRMPHCGVSRGVFAQISVLGCRLRWRSFPAVKGQTRMNPGKFCAQFPTGRWIVRTAKHVFAVVNGVVLDTASPCPGRCIYGAWEVDL